MDVAQPTQAHPERPAQLDTEAALPRGAARAKPSKLAKTTTPGIYRRHTKDCARVGRCECPYVVIHDNKTRTFPDMTEAREGKRIMQRQSRLSHAHDAGVHRDDPRAECPQCEHERCEREQSSPFFHPYVLDWIERYQGTGRRGYREETRDEDRRLIKAYALKFFDRELRVNQIDPRLIDNFIAWLVEQPSRRGGTLSDRSVRNAKRPSPRASRRLAGRG